MNHPQLTLLSMNNLLLIIITLFSFSAFGQNEESRIEREGFIIGFGVGGGLASFSNSYRDYPFEEPEAVLSLPNIKVGFMANSRLALMLSLPGVAYEYEHFDRTMEKRTFHALLPTAQYWTGKRWWISGGLGLAMEFPSLFEDDISNKDWNWGWALSLGTGVEVYQNKNFALDINTNLLLGRVFLDGGGHW